MTRKEHLEFCKICLNRTFSPQEGIICSLTNSIADFESECQHFKEDEYIVTREANLKKAQASVVADDLTFGFDKLGIKNGILAGTILIAVGLVWLLWGLKNGLFFYYSLVLVLFGLIAIIIGLINTYKRQKLQNLSSDNEEVLDHT